MLSFLSQARFKFYSLNVNNMAISLQTNPISMQHIGTFDRTGVLSVYELSNPGLPSTIYFSLESGGAPVIPNNALGKITLLSDEAFEATLGDAKVKIAGTFKVNKYSLFANDLTEVTNIYAHYGLLRAGGICISIADVLASSNDKFLYEVQFYVLDLPTTFQVFKSQLANYSLVQQLSFDIASYESGKRSKVEVIRNTNLYPKVLVSTALTGNDLLIICKDTNGVGGAEHIANSIGIAEESISVTCKVSVVGLDSSGQTSLAYEIIAANPDYSDEPMHVILPMLPKNVIACRVSIDYMLDLQTIGEVVHLTDAIVLTDQQVSLLRPLNAIEISGGATVAFYAVSRENEGIEGVNIVVDDKSVTTQSNGIAEVKLMPGSYTVQITYTDFVKVIPIVVTGPQVVNLLLDVVLIDMQVAVIGSDDYRLPQITMDASNVTKVTDENGVITLRGVEGRVFRITHQLGEVLHEYAMTMDGQDKRILLFNTFDNETLFTDELT